MLRFAVLHHTGSDIGDHFDFLIERSAGKGDLLTFRLPCWPVLEPLEVRQLRDHRRIYLTYEGEVSHNRGHVSRVGEGEATLVLQPSSALVTLHEGRRLHFSQLADDLWLLSPQ